MADHSQFRQRLGEVLPPNSFFDTPDAKEKYGQDWSGLLKPNPMGVVFPKTTEQVSWILKLCAEYRISVVPSGGRTGLSGGAVAANGELIVNLERMNQIGTLDTKGHTLWTQAGAITESIHQHCEPYGLTWPVDFASKGSSQVGGNISTNAGGIHVIRYGSTRNWILGLKVVLINGDVLDLMSPLEKNNTGLDLKQMFIGSEGTLGIVTEAVLKLTPIVQREVAIFSLPTFSAVLTLFEATRKNTSVQLLAFECLSDLCYQEVLSHLHRPSPLSQGGEYYVLIESEKREGDRSFENWLEACFERSLVTDGFLANSSEDFQFVWKIREATAESIMNGREVHQQDVSVPIASLESFGQQVVSKYHTSYPQFEVFVFGHIGDGNLHVFIRKPLEMESDEFKDKCKKSDEELYQLIQAFKGSVSAEHGVGLLKKPAMRFTRSMNELNVMKQLKQIFDPANLLNPGKVLT